MIFYSIFRMVYIYILINSSTKTTECLDKFYCIIIFLKRIQERTPLLHGDTVFDLALVHLELNRLTSNIVSKI